MLSTGSATIDAERAFARLVRARRRTALLTRLRGKSCSSCLAVIDERALRRMRSSVQREIREIPICSIRGTLEPSRATQFDGEFRPAPIARHRWQRVWLAEQRGTPLPPISVVAVGDEYAVRDGHHRVSVARARGALTIDATVDAP